MVAVGEYEPGQVRGEPGFDWHREPRREEHDPVICPVGQGQGAAHSSSTCFEVAVQVVVVAAAVASR
jgi:hypothetical protein